MEVKAIEVFSEKTNFAIVRMPGRKFPGMVIQGDSLWELLQHANRALARARELKMGDENLTDELGMLNENLKDRARFYDQILREHGIELPHSKD